jgi:hypothetical protein
MNRQRSATALFLGVSMFAICIVLAGTQVHPSLTCEYMQIDTSVQLRVYAAAMEQPITPVYRIQFSDDK